MGTGNAQRPLTISRFLRENVPFVIGACMVMATQGLIFRGPGPWIGPGLAIALLALVTILSDPDRSYRRGLTTAAAAALSIASIALLSLRDRLTWMHNDVLPFCAIVLIAILLYGLLGGFIKAMTAD